MTSEWREFIEKYRRPCVRSAAWQLATTFSAYALVWYLIALSLPISTWLVAPLALLASGLLLRIFIIFHDCGHGSFLPSPRANDWVGFIAGVLVFTPYFHWRWEHSIHHATAGRLDRRGTGDIWTLTVQEYLEASRWRRFAYRLARNPFVLFVLAPLFVFGIQARYPSPRAARRERHSVWWTNLALVCACVGMSHLYGAFAFLTIQTAILAVAGGGGIWMFYVQHQFEDVYWERGEDWDYVSAALQGSSFYKLPAVLQWFSASIGFHHVHHLSARIPNYQLQRCHEAHPALRQVRPITLLRSLQTLRLRLWDEDSRKLVGYAFLRRANATRAFVATVCPSAPTLAAGPRNVGRLDEPVPQSCGSGLSAERST